MIKYFGKSSGKHRLGVLDTDQVVCADGPPHGGFLQVFVLVFTQSGNGLQFLCSLVAQWLEGKAEVVVVGQRAQVKVILGINTGRDIDVELKELEEMALHFIHVLHCDVFEDLAVVYIPHGLVVPHFGGQQNGTQDNTLPVTRANVHLCVC